MIKDDAHQVIIVQPRVRFVDPHDCTDAKDELSLLSAVFDTLVTSKRGIVAPGLAQKWSMTEDARSWRFELREDIQFHDGMPCTADAVALSLRRMARADKGYTLGSPGVWHQYMGDALIEATGPHGVSITLSKPVADFPEILSQGFIASPSMIEAMDSGFAAMPCGTGPYRITASAEGSAEATACAQHFRDVGGPRHIRWIAEPDADARFEMLESGHVQVANDLKIDASPASPGVTLHDYINPVAIIFLLNATRGPLADARVRRAMNLAVDRVALIQKVLGGAAEPLCEIMPPTSIGAGRAEGVEADPEAARRLLADAGFQDGLSLAVDCPTRLPDEAEVLTAELGRQLAGVGVSLNVTLHEDREAYAHMVRRKEIGDLCVFDSSPSSTFRVLYEKIDSRVRGAWWQGYQNVGVEAALDLARTTVDVASRDAIYADLFQELCEDPPWLTLYTPMKRIGLAGDHPKFQMPWDGVLDVSALPFA